MMTSVTLSSSSGAIHGGYSSSVTAAAGGETASSSEPEFETTPRPTVKRCLAAAAPSADSCKKRRKQSTPIRISAAEVEEEESITTTIPICSEGKPSVAVAAAAAAVSPEPELRCPVCQLYFDTSDQFQNHIVSDHPPLECKTELLEDLTPTTTPTPLDLNMPRSSDVAWMNDLQNKEWKNPSLANISFNPPNPMFMTLPQFVQSDSNIPRQPIRIFNPDAYCDLCNKEFCNKYFLKTHKANKHGIYTDTPPDTQQPVVSNCVNIPTFTGGNIKPLTSVPSVEIPFIKSEPKIQTNILNPFSDVYPNPFSNKFTPSNVSKQTVPAGAAAAALFESEFSESQNSNGFTYSNENEAKKLSGGVNEEQFDESSSPGVIVNHQHHHHHHPTESTSFKNDFDGMYYEQSKMSPGQLDLSNRLRKIGVMNPKAFCEICCKEYCNKYFLRTHKMKRHGIYIPEDKEKDTKMEAGPFGNFSWQHSMQTSPLNLIMTEQSSSDRKTTSPNDISCDICGIKFQNASLAQLHNISVHGKLHTNKEAAPSPSPFDDGDEHAKKVQETMPNNVSDDNNKSSAVNAEAISEDLQKLQTMILQLNDLDVSKVYRSCSSCNKEFENRYFLHAHMMTEHGILLDDSADADKTAESESSSNNNTMCELSSKEGPSADEIKTHLIEFHNQSRGGEDHNKEEYNEFNTPDKGVNRLNAISGGQITERRISLNVTPTSSYCDICNKELCNKYFMKTHMQRMHGIEIENGAQIGGVVCDICNKELCSKYFLRVHKHNTHGIVEYGSSLLQPRKSDGEPPPLPLPLQPPSSILQPEPDPALKPGDLADLSHRYFSHFTEVCTICSRRFRSTKWLKAHLLSDHGQAGAEKWAELEQQLQQSVGQNSSKHSITDDMKTERSSSPTIKIPNGGAAADAIQSRVGIQNVLSSLFGVDESNTKTYQCSYCSFTTSLLPLLFVHERSHSINSNGEIPQLKCPACPQSFLQPELLQHHLFTQHPFLPLPPFFNGNNNTQGETTNKDLAAESALDVEDNKLMITEECASSSSAEAQKANSKNRKAKSKIKRSELLPAEIGQSLKDVAKRVQLPATYALPQNQSIGLDQQQQPQQLQQDQGKLKDQEDGSSPSAAGVAGVAGAAAATAPASGYVMQAFLLEESAPERRRVVPAVVFLPVVQKQPAPLTVTFTLTPA